MDNRVPRRKRGRKGMGRACALALSACVCLGACGNGGRESDMPEERTIAQAVVPQAQPPRSAAVYDKEETVYVDAAASGEIREITVETRLKCTEGGQVEDRTVLTEIRNTEGDEEYTVGEDGRLIWENNGEDIRYEGKGAEQIPVTVHISYELDGKIVTPEELAGQSGRLRMRFDYDNHQRERIDIEGESLEVCVPFAVFSMVLLPEDVFSDVHVTNGKLVALGEERLAVGYAYPGLADSLRLAEHEETDGKGKDEKVKIEIPDYVEITAQVTDFALEFTATVVSAGIFEDMDTDGLDDVEELIDSMEKLQEASAELVKGCRELTDGTGEFGDYLAEYVDAVSAVKEGTAAIQQGIGALDSGKKSILKGAEALQTGLETLQAAVSGTAPQGTSPQGTAPQGTVPQGTVPQGTVPQGTVPQGTVPQGQEDEGGEENTQDGKEDGDNAAEEAADLNAILTDMNARLTELEDSVGDDVQIQEQITALRSDIQMLGVCLSAMEASSAESMKQMTDTITQLAEGSAKLTEGIKTFNKGIGKLYEGAESLNDGVGELKEAGTELRDGYGELTEGIEALADGVKTFDKEGIQELSKLADGELESMVKRLRAVKEADGRYINYGGILPGRTGSVRFIIETEEIK